jgi:amino acid permease
MFGICVILIPLCLLKDISKMRITSLFSIISLIYAILVIIFETPYYFENFMKNHTLNEFNWYDFSTGFDKHLYFFRGSATVFFAYTCHIGAFPVYKTLRNNIQRRINKVFQRSIILDFVIYLLVAVCGFLTQPLDTPSLIINRNKLFTNDFFMIVARLLMAVNLLLSAPPNFNSFRISILGLISETDEVSNKL